MTTEREQLEAEIAGQGEVVAWMYTEKTPEGFEYRPDFSVKRWVLPHEGYEETPLYTAPPATADARMVPVELLERLMADIESHNYGFDGLQELRAIMEHPK